MLFQIVCVQVLLVSVDSILYDRYTGNKVDFAKPLMNGTADLLGICTVDIPPCDPEEFKRRDGYCNNLERPSRGSRISPYLRMLPTEFASDGGVRPAKDGGPLPLTRSVRTTIFHDGRVLSKRLNMATLHGFEFLGTDVTSTNGVQEREIIAREMRTEKDGRNICLSDVMQSTSADGNVSNVFESGIWGAGSNTTTSIIHADRSIHPKGIYCHGYKSHITADYILVRRYCCTPAGAADPRCLPIIVPEDDPYYRNQNVRCLNFTRAETFQSLGCLPPSKFPETVNLATAQLDLQAVYGTDPISNALIRSYSDGLLRTEYRRNKEMPLIIPNSPSCPGNAANETVCYNLGDPLANFDLRFTSFAIMFLKNHNRMARELRRINKCWNDDELFNTTRKINIAISQSMLYYEVLPILFGRKNLVKCGLLQDDIRFVNEYDPKLDPLIYAEYAIAARFYHSIIEGRVKFYNKNYTESNQHFQSNTLFRSNILEQGNNLEDLNRGTFYQRVTRGGNLVDPDISETMFSTFWRNGDLISLDIQRSRDMGLSNYNAYREICGMKSAMNFEDFHDVMDYDKIEALRSIYQDVNDIDLLAGIASERMMKGTYSGPTLFCIIQRALLERRRSDRFWFERGNYHHAFTYEQLSEIRKMTMARLACDNADGIEYIQPQAATSPRKGNEMVPCEHIPAFDLTKWFDKKCNGKWTDRL